MPTVTVSPKYRVVIPKEIRESMGIEPGQSLHMMVYQDQIALLPILPMKNLRGFAKEMGSDVERDDDRV